MLFPDVPRGKYQHYKGQYYQLIDIAMHSETEEPQAIYRCLYGDYSLWVRPWPMFSETLEMGGKTIKRFAYMGKSNA